MRRFGSLAAVFALVLVLIVAEVLIIRSASKYEPKVKVVFAKTAIPERTVITPDMLELKDVDVSLAHPMSLKNISDAVSKKAAMDIEAGEMILSGKLKSDGMNAIEVKDRNKKLFSVEFKADQANGWWIRTDQLVDIIYVPNDDLVSGAAREGPAPTGVQRSPPVQGNKQEENLQTGVDLDVQDKIKVLEDVRIAALIDEDGNLLKDSGRPVLPRYASFEVTDEQAGLLAYAKSHGRLELSVVPGGD